MNQEVEPENPPQPTLNPNEIEFQQKFPRLEETFTELHRHIMQYMLRKGFVPMEKLQTIIQTVRERYMGYNYYSTELKFGDRDVRDFLQTINAQISKYSLYLKEHRKDGDVWVVLTSTENKDAISQLGTVYSDQQLKFFKSILSVLISSENGYLMKTDLLNEREKMNLDEANATLNQFIDDGWIHCRDGRATVGMRTELDLDEYILRLKEEIEKDGDYSDEEGEGN